MFQEIGDQRPFEAILNQIIENIQQGTLKSGDALPAERIMAESLGVSRPALRETLRALELLGIITSVRGGGNYITRDLDNCLIRPLSILFSLNNSNVHHTHQLRSALEQKAAVLAARNCTPPDAKELQEILYRLDHSDDEFLRGHLDKDLHIKIAKTARNPMIYSVLYASADLIEQMITGIRASIMQKNMSSFEVDSQHHRLVEAIVQNNPELAQQVMLEHMNAVESFIVTHLQEEAL